MAGGPCKSVSLVMDTQVEEQNKQVRTIQVVGLADLYLFCGDPGSSKMDWIAECPGERSPLLLDPHMDRCGFFWYTNKHLLLLDNFNMYSSVVISKFFSIDNNAIMSNLFNKDRSAVISKFFIMDNNVVYHVEPFQYGQQCCHC